MSDPSHRPYPETPETLNDPDELRRQRDEALDALEALAVGAEVEHEPPAERGRLLVHRQDIDKALDVLRRAGRLA